jgi:glycosyltransferase involved in cell wall biosynthesis
MQEIIVVSEAMRSQVLSFGVSANRVHVIACGADLETGCTRRANHAKPVYKVVAVGRLVAKKGPMFLLEAFRQIRDKGVCATLFVIGDGPFLEPMRQYIRAVKLEDCVHLLGALSHVEVKRHLSDADLFLQHSVTAEDGDEEGLPVSIMEAMAASIPVVSTRHAGIPELVTDGLTGFLVEPGDSSDMADRGAELLTDDALRSKMGDAGRRAVADKFSADRSISELRAVLARYCPGLTAHASRPPACLL